MNEPITERIKRYLKAKHLSANKFEIQCGLSHGYLTKAPTEIGHKKLLNILSMCPDINPEWLLTGEGSMLKEQISSADDTVMKPELPIDAAAGSTEDIINGIIPAYCDMRPRIPDFPTYDMTIKVHGDSMSPTFESGDRIAIRQCFDIFQWGAPHVLDTTEGIYVKRIRDEGDSVVCISDNQNYPPFKIPKTCIRRIFRVVGAIRII